MFRRLWHGVGMIERFALICGAAALVALGAGTRDSLDRIIDDHRESAQRLAESKVALLGLQVTAATLAGDQRAIKALLAALAQQPEVERVEWTDTRGSHLAADGRPVALEAPVWFDRMIGLTSAHAVGTIMAGEVEYGSVTLRLSATHGINTVWHLAVTDARYSVVALALVLLAVLFGARRAMQSLAHLVEVVSRFGAGDLTARAALSGSREIAATIRAFNRMAGQIESGMVALRASEQKVRRLAMIAEQTNDAILIRGMNGRITYWNRGAECLFGFTAHEAIGRTSRELHMRNLTDEQFEQMRSQVQSAQRITVQGERLTKSGELVSVESTVMPFIEEDGVVTGAIGVARDITERRQMEEELRRAIDETEVQVAERTSELAAAMESAQQASRAKSEFLANMSHEVRTPINGVLGMLAMLLKSELAPRQRHFAKTAHSSAVALLKVLNDILDFSKIEAGKLELEHIDFSLRECVGGVVQLFAQRAQDKGLEFTCHVQRDVPDALRGDPGRIRQVLANLISNAVKFTETGDVVIRVALVRRDDERSVLRFSVTDTGIGIDPEAQGRILDPFVQANSSTSRRFGGTGLGLAVSRSLVNLMGGELGLESAPGRGSTFWFNSPLAGGRSQTPPRGVVDLGGVRVLAVVPSATSSEILALQFEECGVTADVVPSAARGLALLEEAAARQAPYRFAMLDLDDAAGLRWAREIRARASLDPVRLILISSLATDITAAQLGELRIERVLTKPVSELQLQRALKELVHAAPNAEPQSERPCFDARILVVDDYVVNLEIARDMLEELGCQVDVAGDGNAGVAAVAANRYALVFMDCQMPGMDGYQATAEIRRREQGSATRLPIVALTAHAMRGDRERCLAAGMDDYVSKPFEPEQLQEVLERWLANSGPRSVATRIAADEPPAATPVVEIDPTAIAKLRSIPRPGKPGQVQKWISAFLASTPQVLQAMHDAAADNDAPVLQRYAHTLKSGAAQFGALRFSRRCAALEALATDGDLPCARELLSHLQAEYEPVHAALQLHLHPVDAGATASATAGGGTGSG